MTHVKLRLAAFIVSFGPAVLLMSALPEAPVDIKINQEEVANLPESFDNILPRDGLEPVVRWLWGARWGAL